jgi:23S rRNA-/tRNA-specific pseudouridylate synthase
VARTARRHGHVVVLSGDARQARRWGADGAYGATPAQAPRLLLHASALMFTHPLSGQSIHMESPPPF